MCDSDCWELYIHLSEFLHLVFNNVPFRVTIWILIWNWVCRIVILGSMPWTIGNKYGKAILRLPILFQAILESTSYIFCRIWIHDWLNLWKKLQTALNIFAEFENWIHICFSTKNWMVTIANEWNPDFKIEKLVFQAINYRFDLSFCSVNPVAHWACAVHYEHNVEWFSINNFPNRFKSHEIRVDSRNLRAKVRTVLFFLNFGLFRHLHLFMLLLSYRILALVGTSTSSWGPRWNSSWMIRTAEWGSWRHRPSTSHSTTSTSESRVSLRFRGILSFIALVTVEAPVSHSARALFEQELALESFHSLHLLFFLFLLSLLSELCTTSPFDTWFKSWIVISFERWLRIGNHIWFCSCCAWLFGVHHWLLLLNLLILIAQYSDILYMLQLARLVRALAVL